MAPPREPHRIDRLLEELPPSRAPAHLWERIQEELRSPEPEARALVPGRPLLSRLLAAAAVVLAIVGGGILGIAASYRAPSHWAVSTLTGVPTVAGAGLAGAGTLEPGQWLVTDSTSAARLAIGEIGTAEIRPNTRLRLDPGRGTEHRLTLARGSVRAFVAAPPRLFFIDTPAALATDLGCAYLIEVDSVGTTHLHVTSGWVELGQGERASLVAAGMVAEVDPGSPPGTPYPWGISEEGRAALLRLDRGSADPADLETAATAMYPEGLPAPARTPTTITLWHLLQRLSGPLRADAFEALAAIAPPPARVTREGILALDRPMLERWRRDLLPMWTEEEVSPLVRAARQLWVWAMRAGIRTAEEDR